MSGIGDVNGYGQCIGTADFCFICGQIAVGECSIGQPVSKWECNVHFFCVIIAVSHINPFLVKGLVSVSKIQVGRIIGEFDRHGFCKFAGRIGFAKQDICYGASSGLSAEVCFQYAFYIRQPRHFYRGTVVQDDNGIGLYPEDFTDQLVLAVRQFHVLPVIAF